MYVYIYHCFIKKVNHTRSLVSFKLYDVDKDGYISKAELEHVMLQLVSCYAVHDFFFFFCITQENYLVTNVG